jgi:hypothetical protein
LGAGQEIESMGQQPLTLGAALGGQSAAYGANAGRSLLAGGLGAAATQQRANAYNPFAETLQNLASRPQFGEGVSEWWKNRGASGYGMTDPNVHYGTQNLTQQQIGGWNDAGGGFTGYVPF